MENQRFGRLVVKNLHSKTDKHKKWTCTCDCGNTTVVFQYKLRSGATKSCGCLLEENNRKAADQAKTDRRRQTRRSYYAMVNRCTNPKAPAWPKYGARGITVCDRWLNGDGSRSGWVCFFEDMGPRPAGTSIDRINNEMGYFPENCRWATQAQQVANRRTPTP